MLYGKILYHSTFGSFTILSDDYYIRKIEFGKHPLPDNAVWQENHPLLQEKLSGHCCSRFLMVKPLAMARWLNDWIVPRLRERSVELVIEIQLSL